MHNRNLISVIILRGQRIITQEILYKKKQMC